MLRLGLRVEKDGLHVTEKGTEFPILAGWVRESLLSILFTCESWCAKRGGFLFVLVAVAMWTGHVEWAATCVTHPSTAALSRGQGLEVATWKETKWWSTSSEMTLTESMNFYKFQCFSCSLVFNCTLQWHYYDMQLCCSCFVGAQLCFLPFVKKLT